MSWIAKHKIEIRSFYTLGWLIALLFYPAVSESYSGFFSKHVVIGILGMILFAILFAGAYAALFRIVHSILHQGWEIVRHRVDRAPAARWIERSRGGIRKTFTVAWSVVPVTVIFLSVLFGPESFVEALARSLFVLSFLTIYFGSLVVLWLLIYEYGSVRLIEKPNPSLTRRILGWGFKGVYMLLTMGFCGAGAVGFVAVALAIFAR